MDLLNSQRSIDVSTIVLLDEDDRWVQFKAIHKMQKVPLVIYADFTLFTWKMQGLFNTEQATKFTKYTNRLAMRTTTFV